MVPKGWCLLTLEELANIERGKFSVRPRNDPRYFGGNIPFVQTGDIGSAGTFLTKFSQTLNDAGLKVSKLFPKNTILITIAANIGDTAITTFDVACPDSIVAIHAREDKAHFFWLKMALEMIKDDLDAKATQNAQKNINLQVLRPILFKTPPITEQVKIVDILLIWEKAIRTTEKLLANSEQQKKALMQQLLTGKKRFQGFAEAWVNYSLSEIFEFKRGKGLSKDLLTAIGKKKCILYGELYTKYSEIIKNVLSRTNSSDGFLSKAGDILIPCSTTTNGIDLANAVALLEDDVSLGGDINVLRPKIPIDSSLMAYLLTHVKKHAIASMAQGITIIHLYGSDLKGLHVFIPYALKEQQKITSALSIADSQIEALRKKLEFVKQEKKALMQQLLTGKRRVNAYE